MIKKILNKYSMKNRIYCSNIISTNQKTEFLLRKTIAKKKYSDYFQEISKHHSIAVMDFFVKNFLLKLKKNAIILDVGCGWCWHWRKLSKIRPDIKIVALDFIKENFTHAKKILSKNNLRNIYFLNDNFEKLKLPKESFDAIWSSQAFQHMKNLNQNYKIVYNLLKKNGIFLNFNLNENILVKIKKILINKKKYIKNFYFLNRDITNQKVILKKIFKKKTAEVYCENLFHPELGIYIGRKNNFFSKLDIHFSKFYFSKFISRQVLLSVKK